MRFWEAVFRYWLTCFIDGFMVCDQELAQLVFRRDPIYQNLRLCCHHSKSFIWSLTLCSGSWSLMGWEQVPVACSLCSQVVWPLATNTHSSGPPAPKCLLSHWCCPLPCRFPGTLGSCFEHITLHTVSLQKRSPQHVGFCHRPTRMHLRDHEQQRKNTMTGGVRATTEERTIQASWVFHCVLQIMPQSLASLS